MADPADGSGPGLSYIREVGPQTIIVGDNLRAIAITQKEVAFGIPGSGNRFLLDDSISYNKSSLRTPTADSILILDFISFNYNGSNKVNVSLSDIPFLRDSFDYAYRDASTSSPVIEAPILIGERFSFIYNQINKTAQVFTEYLLLRDEINKKIIHVTHDETQDWPTESLLDPIKINDDIDVRLVGRTGVGTQEIIKVQEGFDFFHLPFYNNMVYHIDYDSFTKFSKLSPRKAQNLTFGDILENKVILIDIDNKIKQYPGEEVVEKALIETKLFYIEHGVLQQMLIDFEKGTNDFTIDSILDNADKTNENKDSFTNISPNKWVGIKNKVSRGYGIKFIMRNLNKMKHMIFRFKTRLRE